MNDDRYTLSLTIQDGWTPLMAASFNGHVDVVHELIETDVHVNQQSKVMQFIRYQPHHFRYLM